MAEQRRSRGSCGDVTDLQEDLRSLGAVLSRGVVEGRAPVAGGGVGLGAVFDEQFHLCRVVGSES